MQHYQRLSAQDASFLTSESEDTPMVIASLMIYDAKNLLLPDGGLDFDRLRRRYAAALPNAPCLTRRLAYVPVLNNPVWVDADEIDLDFHLYRAALPKPNDDATLMKFVERIYNRPLPRDRPLWDAWVIEGLMHDRFAVLLRLHHSLVDGGSGLELMGVLHEMEPDDGEPDFEPMLPSIVPSPVALLAGEIRERLKGAQSLASSALLALTRPAETLRRGIQLAEGFADAAGAFASPSPIDGAAGSNRRVDCFTMPLDELKDIRRNLGGTLNDVILAITAGGLRSYLESYGFAVDDLRLRAACPSNSRTPGQATRGNFTASFIVDLPTHQTSPRSRYDSVLRATRRAKSSHQADAVQFAMNIADRAAPEFVSAMMSLSGRFQNLVVSNVAGPPLPIYFMGCQAQEIYPLTLLLKGAGLAITVFSYDGRMGWSICANASAIPSLAPLRQALRKEFESLRCCVQ